VKTGILVSAYFLPSNLAGAQRARLMAAGLLDFGWQPAREPNAERNKFVTVFKYVCCSRRGRAI